MYEFSTERKSHWEEHLGMLFDPITGEAIAVNIVDDAKIYVPTGYFFERVTQSLPVDGLPLDGHRTAQKLQPWGFATYETAQQVARELAALLPNVRVVVAEGNANTPFPLSHKPWEIVAWDNTRRSDSHNAGLLAQTFARYCTIDPQTGKMRRGLAPVRMAAESIMDSLKAKRDT